MKKLAILFSSLLLAPLHSGAETASTVVISSPGASDQASGDEGENLDSAGTCFNPPMTVCEGCEDECPSETNSVTSIQPAGMRLNETSNDHTPSSGSSGCSPCGGGSGSTGSMPVLSLSRKFQPLSWSLGHLTFGKEQGLNKFDQRISFTKNKTSIVFFDYGKVHLKRGLNFNPVQQC
jgi:hypothetical protein